MPAVRSLVFKYYTLFISSIAYNNKTISPYSCYAKKGLVYIIIADPFSYQPSFCSKYTKLNICTLCDVHLISFNKYIFLVHFTSL